MFKKKSIFYLIIFFIITGFVFFLYFFRLRIVKIITPFFMAVIITYLLRPAVFWLEHKGVKRGLAILVMYGIFLSSLAGLVFFIVPQFIANTRELINILPEITEKYQTIINSLVTSIQSSKWPEDLKNVIYEQIYNNIQIGQMYVTNLLKKVAYLLVEAVTMLFDLILALIIAFYFIKDSDFFRDAFLSLMSKKYRNSMVATGREINRVLNDFVQGQLLTALIVGSIETAGLFLVGVRFAIVLGAIGGLLNIIPYFGPIFGAVPAVFIALIDSPQKAFWTIAVFVIVQQIDNAFISPRIIESRLGLHPVTTIIAVLIGGEFFGILGLFLAVPIMAIIRILFKKIIEEIV